MSPVRSRGCQPLWGCRPEPGLRSPKPATLVQLQPPSPIRAASQLVRVPVCKTGDQGAIPWRHSNSIGGRGELVNTARCDRVMTGSIPVDHPSPVSTMAVQPPCKRSTRVRSLRWAPVLAGSFNGRTRRSERRNLGSIPWPASILAGGPVGTAAFEAALCSDRARSRLPRPVV